MNDFPILDSTRTEDNCPSRVVVADAGFVEPFIDEADYWCTMPMRVTHGASDGLVLELGPYTLNRRDIRKLRDAIRCYDLADNGPTMRRVQ